MAFYWTLDMVGWGESTQYPHKGAKTLTLQTWNGIRAIDFLYSPKNTSPLTSNCALTPCVLGPVGDIPYPDGLVPDSRDQALAVG